ncbi:MAG: chaperone modulator CbpM [Burkholderiales bacterium]
MNTSTVVVGVCLTDDQALDVESFALACGTDIHFVRQLVDEGLVQPMALQSEWRFAGEEIARVRRIRRLQRDFEANLQSVAVMLDLMQENERLRGLLQRAGLAFD